MNRRIVGTIAALGLYACHDVSARAREGYRETNAAAGATDDSVSAHSDSDLPDAGASSADLASDGSDTLANGGSADLASVGVVASAGASSSGSADPLASAGAGGEAGARPSAFTCVPGAECERAKDCWLGALQCRGNIAVCAPALPAPERTPCIFGECTKDGSCIKSIPSCASGDPTECGVITIEGGSFRIGYRASDPAAYAGDPVTVSSFALDVHEASVARFRRFWAAQSDMVRDVTYPNGTHIRVDTLPREPDPTTAHPSYNWSPEPGLREKHPINRLTWATAFLFCAWDGGRLPTEAEWEYAATGREIGSLAAGRDFPWGDQGPDCTLANRIECGTGTSVPVHSFPPWGGLYQMAGNVTEWTADSFTDMPGPCWDGSAQSDPLCIEVGSPYFAAKGGSYAGSGDQLFGVWRLKSQNGVGPRGVRCARDLLGDPLAVHPARQLPQP